MVEYMKYSLDNIHEVTLYPLLNGMHLLQYL